MSETMRVTDGEKPGEWLAERTRKMDEYLKGDGAMMARWAQENASSPKETKEHEPRTEGGGTKWIDRTGDARKELKGGFEVDKTKHSVYIAQGKEYGRRLETINHGQYAICDRTLKHFMPFIERHIKEAFNDGA